MCMHVRTYIHTDIHTYILDGWTSQSPLLCYRPPVINGEKAAFSLPVFAEKRERTLDLLIKGVEQKFRVSLL